MGDIKAPKFTGTNYQTNQGNKFQAKALVSQNNDTTFGVDTEEYDVSSDVEKDVSEISTDIDGSVDGKTNSNGDKYGLGEDSVKDYYKKVKAMVSPEEINNNYENDTDADVDVKEVKSDFSLDLDFEIIDYLNMETSIKDDQMMYDIITDSIEELQSEIEKLESAYNALQTRISGAGPGQYDDIAEWRKEAERIEKELTPLKNDLSILKTYQLELKKRIDLITSLEPYKEKMKTGEYQQFSTMYKIRGASSWLIDSQLLEDCNYNLENYTSELWRKYSIRISPEEIDKFALVEYLLQSGKSIDEAMVQLPDLKDACIKYKYLSEEERMMYHYLFRTEGPKSAEEYLKNFDDVINKAKGTEDAIKFLNGLDLTDEGKLTASLDNLFDVNGKGFVDGIGTFFEGLDNVFQNNGTMSSSDYEKAIVLQYLQQNSELFDEMYEFSSAFGNMVPSILASFAVSMVASPLAGAEVLGASQAGNITGSTLMGLSAMGNAKHQALIGGADPAVANIYGILIGLSETTLTYFLGNIPGLSESAGLTISGMLREGVEEYLQEWIAAGLQAVLLGEDVDWDSIPENAQKSFWMGVLMSGFLNGGQEVVNIMINGVTVQINIEETLEYLNEHPGTDVIDAIEKTNPGPFDFLIKNQLKPQNISMDVASITNEITRLIGNNSARIPNAIEAILNQEFSTNRNNANLKMICEVGINYIKQSYGYTTLDAASLIGDIYIKVLNNIGFDSYRDPDTGIKINFLKGLKGMPVTPKNVLADLKKLPKGFTKCVKRINFYDTFNPYDFYWVIKQNRSDGCTSMTGGNGDINFWKTGYSNVYIIAHETAHSYDMEMAKNWGVETKLISDSKLWQDAIKFDYQSSGLYSVTDYGTTSFMEDFAESVALFYTNPSALDAFPARKAILMKYMPQS